eukprot:12428760-Karenia_brevis.AAC.1
MATTSHESDMCKRMSTCTFVMGACAAKRHKKMFPECRYQCAQGKRVDSISCKRCAGIAFNSRRDKAYSCDVLCGRGPG